MSTRHAPRFRIVGIWWRQVSGIFSFIQMIPFNCIPGVYCRHIQKFQSTSIRCRCRIIFFKKKFTRIVETINFLRSERGAKCEKFLMIIIQIFSSFFSSCVSGCCSDGRSDKCGASGSSVPASPWGHQQHEPLDLPFRHQKFFSTNSSETYLKLSISPDLLKEAYLAK